MAAEKFHPIAVVDEYRKKIETTVALCSQEITERICQILTPVILNYEMELKQHLFHVFEAPDPVSLQDTIQPLFGFVEHRFLPFKEFLIRQNFSR